MWTPSRWMLLALDVIDRAARRRDDDVDPALKGSQLKADRLAAVHGQHADRHFLAVAVDRLGDLHRELARGNEDQGGNLAVASVRVVFSRVDEPVEHGQGKGRGLARAGGSLREDVLAGEEEGNGLALDGRRLLVAQLNERRHELLVELKRRKAVVCCPRVRLGLGLGGLLVRCPSISHAVHGRPSD